jgi:acyl-CoA reductase-like NAD-dependent aldehyde dehydrogenase
MLIGGRLALAEGASLRVVNPATEEIVAEAPDATERQLGQAIEAATRAFATWRTAPIDERRRLLGVIASSIREHCAEFATLLTSEQGKPLSAAELEVESAAAWCDWFAACEFSDEEIRRDGAHRLRIRHVPLGVVAIIVPWNFPVSLAIHRAAPALLAGNTIVVKPSPLTPLTMLRLGEILTNRVPAGVINVISGGDGLGPKLTAHPGIRKIAFTGSTLTGRKVMQSAAEHLTRLTLELGGNDAAVILPDVDLDMIAHDIFKTCFRNSGQVCLATKRVYVHDDIYDEFAKRFVEVAARARVGNGMDEGVELGPIQNRAQYDKVRRLIEDCERAGLDYGLGGSVWGRDLEAAEEVAERIDSGVVWVNEAQRVAPDFPMAGHKSSGIGAENGIEGLLQYTQPHVISVRAA